MAGIEESVAVGVRARGKLRTRQGLQSAAKELFEEHGYDNVTVAEIAGRAGVSTRTLFQHFGSKEDLLISELDELHGDLIRALRHRDRSGTPLQAVTNWIFGWHSRQPPDGFDRFMRMVGAGPSVQAMRRRLYDDWENALVGVLADEANEARPTPRTRLIAAELIAMIRVLTSPELLAFLERYPPERRKEAQEAWILEAVALLAHGLKGSPAAAV